MIHLLPDAVLAEGAKYLAASAPQAAPAVRDDARAELEKLKGSWALVYWLFDGNEQPTPNGRIIMSFAGAAFAIGDDRGVFERGRVEGLAPDRDPKSFEYVPTEVSGRSAGLKYPGIYLLHDDLFIACIGYGGVRPGTFSAEAGSRTELVVYKRLRG